MKSVTAKPEPVLCYPPLHLQTPLLHRTVDRPRSTPPPINPPQVHAVTWPSPLALVKLHCLEQRTHRSFGGFKRSARAARASSE